jgi:hypothetical protein
MEIINLTLQNKYISEDKELCKHLTEIINTMPSKEKTEFLTGKVININKNRTGIGFTHWVLNYLKPCILVAPTRQVLISKSNEDNIFLDSNNTNIPLEDNKNYLITGDSFHKLVNKIKNRIILFDECQDATIQKSFREVFDTINVPFMLAQKNGNTLLFASASDVTLKDTVIGLNKDIQINIVCPNISKPILKRIKSRNITGSIAKYISLIREYAPNTKIVVAIERITEIENIVNKLNLTDFGYFISETNKSRLKGKYRDYTRPITFINASAYTGWDMNLDDNNAVVLVHSGIGIINTFQSSGRLRNGFKKAYFFISDKPVYTESIRTNLLASYFRYSGYSDNTYLNAINKELLNRKEIYDYIRWLYNERKWQQEYTLNKSFENRFVTIKGNITVKINENEMIISRKHKYPVTKHLNEILNNNLYSSLVYEEKDYFKYDSDLRDIVYNRKRNPQKQIIEKDDTVNARNIKILKENRYCIDKTLLALGLIDRIQRNGVSKATNELMDFKEIKAKVLHKHIKPGRYRTAKLNELIKQCNIILGDENMQVPETFKTINAYFNCKRISEKYVKIIDYKDIDKDYKFDSKYNPKASYYYFDIDYNG